VIDDYHDYIGTFEYWWTHGLISDSTYKKLNIGCDFGSIQHPSVQCLQALTVAITEQGNIDGYSINTPPCNNTTSLRSGLHDRYVSLYAFNSFTLLTKTITCISRSVLMIFFSCFFFPSLQPWMYRAYDPCAERYSDVYFNRPEVQKALHANVTGISYAWKACRYINFNLVN
jgi:serine carboxypeptidase-like clade II